MSMSPILAASVISIAVLGAGVALVLALGSNSRRGLSDSLDDYGGVAVAGGGGSRDFMNSAVGVTEGIAQRTGLLEKAEQKLEQADVPIRPAEALFFYFAGLLVLFFLSWLVSGNPITGLIVAFVAAMVPPAVLERRRSKRLKQFEAMLPDTLSLLSGTLRAGFSFIQGMEAVANETAEPMRRELQRAFTEAKLGVAVDEALDDVAVRMQSEDLRWAVLAIKIQREVGGNLAELLDTVSSTMIERERLRAEIKALTAEGRISAIILGAFPFAMGAILYVVNPQYISTLFESMWGIISLLASFGWAGIGFLWLKKMMAIEV